jgi:hypothetical protein
LVLIAFTGSLSDWRSSVIFSSRFCHLTDTTLAEERQKRELFLSADRMKLTVGRQNVWFPIEGKQRLSPPLFLKVKTSSLIRRRARHITMAKASDRRSPSFQIAEVKRSVENIAPASRCNVSQHSGRLGLVLRNHPHFD